MAKKWVYAIVLVIGLAFLSLIVASIIGLMAGMSGAFDTGGTGNVMHLSLSGPILEGAGQGLFASGEGMVTHIKDNIRRANEDPGIDAVVLSIDSPGGGAVASYEIVQALDELEKPSVSVVGSLSASGAYWIASSTDRIITNPLSMLGSVGVTSSYLEVSGLLEEYNVTYERLVAGDMKDAGSPLRPLDDDSREMLQGQIDRVHEFFVEDVSEKRGLSSEQRDYLSDARIFLGKDSVDYNIADQLGGIDDAKDYLEQELNKTVDLREVRRRTGGFPFLSAVSEDFGFNFGRGFASWLYSSNEDDELISLR